MYKMFWPVTASLTEVFLYREPVCKDWERQLFCQMPNFQEKITKHTKKTEKHCHSKEQNKSLETNYKETHASDLLDSI